MPTFDEWLQRYSAPIPTVWERPAPDVPDALDAPGHARLGDVLYSRDEIDALPIGTELHLPYTDTGRNRPGSWRLVTEGSWQSVHSDGSTNYHDSVTSQQLGAGWRIVYLPQPGEPVRAPSDCDCHTCNRRRGGECACDMCRVRRGEEVIRTCAECGNEYRYMAPGYGFDSFCSDECYESYFDLNDDPFGYDEEAPGRVHNYSYCPPLNFLRANDEPDENLFFGFELEVPTDYESEFAEKLFDSYGREESLLYCKEDGSIQGVEIVSHPMTHKYFREQFPFEMFDGRRKLTQLLRQRTPSEGYGLHVHVSRDGFKNEAHTLRWLLLIYRNQEAVQALARRTSDEWAHFADDDRCVEKARNVTRRRRWDYERAEEVERESPGYQGERYVAVNAQNPNTFELRMFRSTWNVQQFRAAIDFAHATVAYSRGLTAPDIITRGDGLSFDRFRAWAAERPQYESLTKELDRVLGARPQANLFPELEPVSRIPLSEREEELACAS